MEQDQQVGYIGDKLEVGTEGSWSSSVRVVLSFRLFFHFVSVPGMHMSD